MKDQTVFRRAKDRDNPFVMIDKEMLERPEISWKAKGLLSYLLSRPDDWEVWLNDLLKRSTDGEHATKTGLRELEQAGYLTRHRQRDEAGRFSSTLVLVHEIPVPLEQRTYQKTLPQGENPPVDNPLEENPQVDNRPLTNTDPIDTDLTDTDSTDILPATAEIPPSQPSPVVAFPETDNPDSVSNGVSEEVALTPSEGDYVADVLQRQSAKASFTVPPTAGGADGAGDAMLEAWVAIKGYLLVDLPRDDRRKWPRQLGKLAEKHDLTAVQAVQAMKVVLDQDNKEFGYYTYTAPSVAKFKLDFGEVAMRIKGGGNGYKSTRAPPVKARTAADYEKGDEL